MFQYNYKWSFLRAHINNLLNNESKQVEMISYFEERFILQGGSTLGKHFMIFVYLELLYATHISLVLVLLH